MKRSGARNKQQVKDIKRQLLLAEFKSLPEDTQLSFEVRVANKTLVKSRFERRAASGHFVGKACAAVDDASDAYIDEDWKDPWIQGGAQHCISQIIYTAGNIYITNYKTYIKHMKNLEQLQIVD